MSKTAAEYRAWFRGNATPCVLVELDYMYQVGIGVSAVPTRGTLYYSNVAYVDEEASPPRAFDSVLLDVPAFERSLDRATLRGKAAVTISGDFVLNNTDKRQNRVLYLANDGSDVRVYIGDPSWTRSDFIHLFTVQQAKASAAVKPTQLEISARDIGLALNKSIGGTVLVGGSGPNAEKYRPLPFGLVHNMAPLLMETAPSYKYTFSDRGTNASVPVVRADGADLTVTTEYTDNGDGTFTLVNNPQGSQITNDALLYGAGKTAVDYRISDAIEFFVGGEAGLTAAGQFAGAHASYFDSGVTVHPANDYFCQSLFMEKTNLIAWLEDAMGTANGFWAPTRLNLFQYGRMRPEALSAIVALSGGRLTVRAEIGEGDIVRNTIKVDHALPSWVSYQCLGNVNQTKQSTFAGSLTALQRTNLERDGLPGVGFGGEEPGTTQYLGAVAGEPYKGGAPELYHLSLSAGSIERTLISGPDDTSAPDPIGDPTNTVPIMLRRRASIRRGQKLPWTEFVDFDTFMVTGRDDSDPLYDLELGDVVNLTYPLFDLEGGALHQLYKVGFRAMKKRMNLGVCRRRFAGVSAALGAGVAWTFYVHDTFTASDATVVLTTPHIGEIGATWTRVSGFGADDDGEFVIYDNAVRRPTFAENPGADAGEAMMYPSGVVPVGSTKIYVEFGVQFVVGDSAGFVALYEKANASPSNADFLFSISNPEYGTAGKGIQIFDGATTTEVPFVAVGGQNYVVGLVIDGAALRLYVDDVLKATWSRATQPLEAFGLDIYDAVSDAVTSVDHFDVAVPAEPIAPTTTDFFLDEFAGSGDLSTHAPDVGGAYTSDGGALTDMTLDGSGNLVGEITPGGAFARSVCAPVVPFYLEVAFTCAALDPTGSDQVWIDVFTFDTGTSAFLAETFLRYHGSPPAFSFIGNVYDSSNTVLFSCEIDVTGLITTGVEHKARATVTASGTIFELDGALVCATPQVPDITGDAVEFEANIPSGTGASLLKYNYIRGASLASAPTVPFFLYDSFAGGAGLLTSHTGETGHAWAYSANMIFAGYSPHSGDAKIDGSGVVGIDTAGGYAAFVSDFAPSSPDYYVEARVQGSFAHSQRCGIAGRYVEASGAGYFLETFPVDATHVAVTLQFWDGGANSGTLIARGGDHVVSDATDYRVRLAMTGTTVECFVDGGSIGSVTDAHVTGAGTIGGWLAPSGSGTYDQIAFDHIKAAPL